MATIGTRQARHRQARPPAAEQGPEADVRLRGRALRVRPVPLTDHGRAWSAIVVAPSLIPEEARRSGEDRSARRRPARPAAAQRRSRPRSTSPPSKTKRSAISPRPRGHDVRLKAAKLRLKSFLLRLGITTPAAPTGTTLIGAILPRSLPDPRAADRLPGVPPRRERATPSGSSAWRSELPRMPPPGGCRPVVEACRPCVACSDTRPHHGRRAGRPHAIRQSASAGYLRRPDTASEHTSGERRRQGGITKAGNCHARRAFVEAAWAYRYPAKDPPATPASARGSASAIQDIGWKAQVRLCKRFRRLHGPRQAPQRRRHGDRAGDRRLHVGDRPPGPARPLISRSAR